jgi:hypothetical protein
MRQRQIDQASLLERIKEWYNGFSWDGIHTLYNPFGTLNFLYEGDFSQFLV